MSGSPYGGGNDSGYGSPMGGAQHSQSGFGGQQSGVYAGGGDHSGANFNQIAQMGQTNPAGFSPIRLNKGREHNLDIDPRTQLKIMAVPPENRVNFADLQDVVLHIFFTVRKTDGNERIFIVTDQSVMLCAKDGTVSRCFMVEKIYHLVVCNDHRALGFRIPSEFDMILKFSNPDQRDRSIVVLRQVYKHRTKTRLEVEQTNARKLEPAQFKVDRPANFRLTIIPQLTKEDLRKSLKIFEEEEEALLEELDELQLGLEDKHNTQMTDLHGSIEDNVAKLKESVKEVWGNDEKLGKIREDVQRGRRLIEQVDGAFGADDELPLSKDAQIAELELIAHRLQHSVYAAEGDSQRKGMLATGAANYMSKDFEDDLHAAAWPNADGVDNLPSQGAGSAGAISGRSRQFQDAIVKVDGELASAREVLVEGQELERQLQMTEERIAQLRHLQRTGAFERNPTAKAGGLIGVNQAAAPAGGPAQPGIDPSDPTYSWLAELPSDLSVDTLQVDPRTGLSFIQIPATMSTFFVDAADAVLHYFSVVKKPSKVGDMVRRILMISDQALYLCTSNAVVKRCVDLLDIEEILTDTAGTGIGFRVPNDYDIAFTCTGQEHRPEIIEIIQRIYKFTTGGRKIPVSEVPKHRRLEGFLNNLQQPEGYTLKLTPFRPRQELVDKIKERREQVMKNAPVTISAAGANKPSGVNMKEDQYHQLRADVARQMEYEWRQDSALVQLRSQLDHLTSELRQTEEEVHSLKSAVDNHRCETGVGMNAGTFPLAPGSGIIPTSGPGTFRPNADGLFFIKVDPVQLNCELDILKLTYTRDYLFTGHSNGFVNVWDLQSKGHGLRRSLREHTGRITDLKASPLDLLTAGADGVIRRWDLSNGACTTVMNGHKGPVNCIDSHGGKLISGGADSLIHIWNLEKGQDIGALKGHHSAVVDLKFEGDMVVSCEWGWILFWDMRSGKVVRSLRDEHGGLTCLDYSEGVAVAGGSGGDLTIWDISRGAGETINAHQDDVLDVQLSGKSCISSGGDYKIKMWDLQGMKSLGTFHESHPFETRTFHMEGRRFIAGQGQFAKIWTK